MDVTRVRNLSTEILTLRGINFSYHSSGYYMINTKDKELMESICIMLVEKSNKLECELKGEL